MQNEIALSSVQLYLCQVLGVESVILSDPDSSQADSQADLKHEIVDISVPKRVLFLLERELSSEANLLLQKMILAMKLSVENYQVKIKADLGPGAGPEAFRFFQTVEFVESLDLEPAVAEDVIHTWSPEILLLRPELKKKVWDDLQVVMKRLLN